MIFENNKVFVLETAHTSYIFQVMETGHLEHLYYGRKLYLGKPGTKAWESGIRALSQKKVNRNSCGVTYDKDHPALGMDDVCLEVSGRGTGDLREPFAEIVWEDGSWSVDFVYKRHEIVEGKPELETLPSAYDDTKETTTLIIYLKDKYKPLKLELRYTVFPSCDCIVRSTAVQNLGTEDIRIERLMSMQLDMEGKGYEMISFRGDWGNEMQRYQIPVNGGTVVNSSATGFSSNQANPFTMLAVPGTTEEHGECLASNLIYSGNHYEAVQVSGHNKTRFVAGINPEQFSWKLGAQERFEAPEAVFTFSEEGFGGISKHMHAFVREHIVRGEWKYKERPILLNSWEAAYFNFTESKLLKLAKTGKEAGIELFVLDDGWFGKRNSDTCSLGDWTPNSKKLPKGIKGIAEKVEALGLKFGIWVEPEMVNEDSDLYRAHPNWAVRIPGRGHSEGRNQMLLDFTRTEVQDNIIEQMSAVFSDGPVSYVKWDMNRNFSDLFSRALSADRQKEFGHRYILGLYRVVKTLVERFPHILFEGCASGGNRFDLGMLCYMPQIWASDDSDAICRTYIQNGYSYGYPQSVMTAHVSNCPNHQTLRNTPLETRFAVAAFGVLGYECNLAEMPKEEVEEIKEQIRIYKEWRSTLQYGQLYRTGGKLNEQSRFGESRNLAEWTIVSPDKEKAVGMMVQETVKPNTYHDNFRTRGLDDEKIYHFTGREMKYDLHLFGDLINAIAPIHIKKDSVLHNTIAKFVKMDSEKEDHFVSGSVLNHAGIELAQAFAATGYEKNTRLYKDFDARVYFMEEIKDIE
ncbi:MAG: alpha-galactosidase [Ruminococcus sp.]|nr:alpha-galactosidase [Ruminococcus sp.]